jgi:hypothetical protein
MSVLDIFLSGAEADGRSQLDPNLSIGNYRSQKRLKDDITIEAPTNVTGVTIDEVSRTHNFKPVTGTLTAGGNTVVNAGIDTPTGAATWRPTGGDERKLLLNMGYSVTVEDESGKGHVVTHNGGVLAVNNDSPFTDGWSLSLDGSGDWLSIPDSTDFDFSADFTVEVWAKTTVSTGNHYILGSWNTAGAREWVLHITSAGLVNFPVSSTGADNPFTLASTTAIDDGAWHHLEVTRTGNDWRLFIDGVQEDTTNNATSIFSGTIALEIGSQGGGNNKFTGNITGIEINNGISKHQANFSVPTIQTIGRGVVRLHIKADEIDGTTTLTDESISAHTITSVGNTQVERLNNAVENSFGNILLDGTGDYGSIADHNDFKFDANDFTIDCFVKTTNTGTQTIISQWESSGNQRSWRIRILNGIVDFSGSTDGIATSFTVTATTDIKDGAWHHIRAVRVGDSQKLFIDGVKEGTDGTTTGALHNSTAAIFVGAITPSAPTNYLDGNLDDFIVTNGIALSTANFTPRTAPYDNALKQKLEFTAFGDTVREETNFANSTEEITRSDTQTMFLRVNTGAGTFDAANKSITVNDAEGVLTYTNTGTTLQYTAPSDTIGVAVNVGAGGTFEVASNDTNFFINVTVAAGSLPVSDQSDTLTISKGNNIENLFNNLTKAEGVLGRVDYRALYVKNNSGGVLSALDFFVQQESLNLNVGYDIAIERPSNGKVLHLTMDGADASTTFTDLSANAHTITANGNAQVDTAVLKFTDGSLLLDGTGDYLSISDHADFHFDADFTIDMFVKTSDVGIESFISQWEASNKSFLIFHNNGVVNFLGSDDGTTDTFTIQSTTTINDGNWHNIRAVRYGNVTKLFIDGVREGTDGTITLPLNNITGDLVIGGNASPVTNEMTGSIDDLFVVKGAALSVEDFTPRTSPIETRNDMVLHLTMDGADASTTFTDVSSTGHTVTANGNAQVDTAFVAFARGSLLCDGTGDYLSAADHADWHFGSGDFVIDCFVKTSSTAAQTIISQWETSGNQRSWLLDIAATTGLVSFAGSVDGIVTNSFLVTSTTAVNDGSWHHIRAIRNGNSQELYIDGTKEGTDGTFTGSLHNSTAALFIGASIPSVPAVFFNGSIDDVYIIKGSSTSGNFTPRTLPENPDKKIQSLATSETTPVGLEFGRPPVDNGLTIEQTDLADDDFYGLWIRRTVEQNTIILNNNTVQVGMNYSFV